MDRRYIGLLPYGWDSSIGKINQRGEYFVNSFRTSLLIASEQAALPVTVVNDFRTAFVLSETRMLLTSNISV